MSETLYIRLGEHAAQQVNWLVWSTQEHEVIASGELANVSELSNIADKTANRQVVVFVSSANVTLKHLHMPAKSDRAMRAAVPYALEDDLAADVDQLFFAYGKKVKVKEENHNCFVAIVDHEQMSMWQQWLSDAGIYTKHLIPDVLAMPNEDAWTAITLGDQTLVRYGAWSGAVIDNTWLPLFLTQLDKQLEDEQSVYCYSDVNRDECEQLVFEAQPEELPLSLLAQHCELNAFNLLQGQYKPKENTSPLVKRWLIAASVAALALILNLTVKGIELNQLNNQITVLDADIVNTYKEAFPETRRIRVSTVRSQLNGKLRELSGGDESVTFLSMLQQLEPAFANVKQVKPISIRFDGKRQVIRLQASANSYQSFDRFKLQAEERSLEVTPGSQNNQGDKIVGSFTIRSKS